MRMTLKELIKLVTPPLFIHLAKRFCGSSPTDAYGLSGDYHGWAEAVAASTGYDSEDILEKTKLALLKVKHSEAEYERDSVLFNKIEYSWPLLAGLMWVAAQEGGRLNVLDFGGSFGSTYYQNRRFLQSLCKVSWNIVEQPHFVEVGKELFENDELHFYCDIKTCLEERGPKAMIISGVLQYLEEPYVLLREVLNPSFKYVLIDRTPFWRGGKDRLQIQKAPPSIFDASYPIWIFSLDRFREMLASHEVKAEFAGFEDGYGGYDFRGFIIKVKNVSKSE